MRRLLLIAAGMAALTLSVPGAALASHGHNHHHKRKAHHAKIRFEHVGPTGTSITGSSTGTAPVTGSSPTTTPAPENAGKVASYTGGVLTLTLNDNSSVSGKVTSATRIECVSATAPPPGMEQDNGNGNGNGPGDDNGSGDDNHQGDQQHEGNQQPSAPVAGQLQSTDDNQGSGDDQDDEGQGSSASEPPCDTSALVTNAIVRAAELRIGPSGTEFESIVLVR
ncbi:MAG TPA: hypothetical protein VGY76_02640 [Solirubrobacteraceae bacterium]|jgi:hypothetical protein|nr:hypothetical protein [Solirubrobacteraceae bacterium]